MTSLADEMPKEQARVREILARYKFGAAMIEADLQRADQAMASGDVVAILRAYKALKDVVPVAQPRLQAGLPPGAAHEGGNTMTTEREWTVEAFSESMACVRFNDDDGDWASLIGRHARERAEFIARAVNSHAALVDAAEAAIAYDEAIKSCANDPERMSSYCSAQGDDLDTLYADWRDNARNALAAARGDA